MKAPLELDARPVTIKLVTDVKGNVGKIWLEYLTGEYYRHEEK
jgi:hypothetical protein